MYFLYITVLTGTLSQAFDLYIHMQNSSDILQTYVHVLKEDRIIFNIKFWII